MNVPAGRPPKPTALHKLEGTLRQDRHSDTVRADSVLLEPPDHLDEVARIEWLRVAGELHNIELTTSLDLTLLEQYCVVYSQWRAAIDDLQQYGAVQKTKTGYSQQTGYFTVAVKLGKEVRDIAREFGLTPSSRTRLRIHGQGSEGYDILSELDKIVGRE